MKFLKDHHKLRVLIITLLFVIGLVLTFIGWSMTGQLLGLGIMVVGIIFLLTSIFVYNKAYT